MKIVPIFIIVLSSVLLLGCVSDDFQDSAAENGIAPGDDERGTSPTDSESNLPANRSAGQQGTDAQRGGTSTSFNGPFVSHGTSLEEICKTVEKHFTQKIVPQYLQSDLDVLDKLEVLEGFNRKETRYECTLTGFESTNPRITRISISRVQTGNRTEEVDDYDCGLKMPWQEFKTKTFEDTRRNLQYMPSPEVREISSARPPAPIQHYFYGSWNSQTALYILSPDNCVYALSAGGPESQGLEIISDLLEITLPNIVTPIPAKSPVTGANIGEKCAELKAPLEQVVNGSGEAGTFEVNGGSTGPFDNTVCTLIRLQPDLFDAVLRDRSNVSDLIIQKNTYGKGENCRLTETWELHKEEQLSCSGNGLCGFYPTLGRLEIAGPAVSGAAEYFYYRTNETMGNGSTRLGNTLHLEVLMPDECIYTIIVRGGGRTGEGPHTPIEKKMETLEQLLPALTVFLTD